MLRTWILGTGVAAVLAAACTSSPSGSSTPAPSTTGSAAVSGYRPVVDPEDLIDSVDNPYFPLVPGTTFVLRGRTEDGVERDEVTVTNRTKEILGVTCVVVHDRITVAGELREDTFDWYAQDRDGNVWYFGEDTREYEDGVVVSTEGSWQAGVDGAQPGIVMPAHPQVTDSYRQEYDAGHAEDMFWVVAVGETVSVPAGTYDDVIRTLEWTPLEPGVVSEKRYAPGVGLVAEADLAGGLERFELVRFQAP